MQICTWAQLCIRLISPEIHSSNNNTAAHARLFIPVHALQLLVQHAYQHPQAPSQQPLSFEYSIASLSVITQLLSSRTFWSSMIMDTLESLTLGRVSLELSLIHLSCSPRLVQCVLKENYFYHCITKSETGQRSLPEWYVLGKTQL